MARSTAKSPKKAPRPTTIVLVRHGQTGTTGQVLPGRAPGLHLADEGRAQAEVAASLVADGPEIAAIYTSPLERARETAAPIATAVGQRAVVDKGLLECDFGEWTGEKLATLMKKPEWTTVQRAPSTFRFPGGESFTEMQTRIVGTLDRLRAKHEGGTIVCVSHADPIKAAVADALGTHLDLFQRINVSPCSVTAVHYGPGGPAVLAVNSVEPLSSLVPS
jgi:probable phosphomutase (TIGR03848 family)